MDFALLLLSLSLFSQGMCEPEYDADYQDSCLPRLADNCFKGLIKSLTRQLEDKSSETGDFCSMATDSLQCASDIIDTDCKDGRTNFDAWLRGLQAVKEEVCKKNGHLLKVITSPEVPCFNMEDFLECVEEIANVTHVIDMLTVSLNKNECNRLLIALPTCNVRANAAHNNCHLPQEVINEVIYTFFSHSQCGAYCPEARGSAFSIPSCTLKLNLLLFFLFKYFHNF